MEIRRGVWLDARRAVWLAEVRMLVVSDLHLGYAWAHRAGGNLLPVMDIDDAVNRLAILVDAYQPDELVLLGDIVHGFTQIEALHDEMRRLILEIGQRTRLRFVVGNHDVHLPQLLRELAFATELATELRAGPHLLLHGDQPDDIKSMAVLAAAHERDGVVIFGHEHPAINISDGTASLRVPCFAIGADAIVLPAFTAWSAGTNVRSGNAGYFSHMGSAANVDRAVAIVAGKLMPMAL